jgi:NAD(P)-dependent dehydrogenase (short-subunit alcohol dehydrogenase family)
MKTAVIVLDAMNGIGRGLTQAVIDAHRPLIAVSSDAPALAELQANHPGADLTTVLGSVESETASAALASELLGLKRPIGGILVSRCRDQVRGRMLDQPAHALQLKLELDLVPQLSAARHLLPVLAASGRNGSYVLIGGPGSENPWAGYGHHSVCAAATNMLVRVLHDEARTLAVRVQMLAVDLPARTANNAECSCDQWPTAIAIGTQALALVDQLTPSTPVQAIVRFIAPATPVVSAAPRARSGTRTPTTPVRVTTFEPEALALPANVAPLIDDPTSKTPQRYLDDTWALLKPLLTAARNEDHRS